MRLLNTRTLRVEECDPGEHKYAILSHTWDPMEVTLKDLRSLRDRDKRQLLEWDLVRGTEFEKIVRCCHIAQAEGHEYVWIDTVCIDKESSSELSESINSMYQWYSSSVVCYVYLADFNHPSTENEKASFMACRWFTRGWTLQELIAPDRVKFFNTMWQYIGSKEDLLQPISGITGIDYYLLSLPHPLKRSALRQYSVAAKLSWASQRVTTRKEDRAYCLLGLFDINMPLLYGEGDNAFRRLQEHIIATSADHSILLWHREYHVSDALLARSPSRFIDGGNIVPIRQEVYLEDDFSFSARGVSLVCPIIEEPQDRTLSAVLNCRYANNLRGPILLPLIDLGVQTSEGERVVTVANNSLKPDADFAFDTYDVGNEDPALSSFRSYSALKDIFPAIKLLLVKSNAGLGMMDFIITRVTFMIRTCDSFNERFALYDSRPIYNKRTQALTWTIARRLDPLNRSKFGLMTWRYRHAQCEDLLSINFGQTSESQCILWAGMIPNDRTKTPYLPGWDVGSMSRAHMRNVTKVLTLEGLVEFQTKTETVLGDLVHVLNVSLKRSANQAERSGASEDVEITMLAHHSK